MLPTNIDLVRIPLQHSCFMFTNDAAYATIPKENRGVTMEQHRADLASGNIPGCVTYDMSNAHASAIFQRIMSDFWQRKEDFTYVDVGAQYGSSSMSSAAFIKSNKMANHTS